MTIKCECGEDTINLAYVKGRDGVTEEDRMCRYCGKMIQIRHEVEEQ